MANELNIPGFKHYELDSTYQAKLAAGEVNAKDLSFVKETGKIYTQGGEYGGGGPKWSYLKGYGAGEIVYVDSSGKIKKINPSKWNQDLGFAIGVVVVPKWMSPDGKARIMSLFPVDASGNASNSNVGIEWGTSRPNMPKSYRNLPIINNAGQEETVTTDFFGFLPSDSFSGTPSFVDPIAYYSSTSRLVPSPYKGDSRNDVYFVDKINNLNNALSDFYGKSNTEFLVGELATYKAAKAAWLHKDGVSNLQWYLPGLGELGFLTVRLQQINSSISLSGGVQASGTIWSSTWFSNNYCPSCAYVNTGGIGMESSTQKNTIRPFAIID